MIRSYWTADFIVSDDISKLYQQHSGRFLKSRLVTRDPVTTLRSGMAIVK